MVSERAPRWRLPRGTTSKDEISLTPKGIELVRTGKPVIRMDVLRRELRAFRVPTPAETRAQHDREVAALKPQSRTAATQEMKEK